MINKFKQLIDERLNSKVIVETAPESERFNETNVLESVVLGDIQMAASSLSKLTHI